MTESECNGRHEARLAVLETRLEDKVEAINKEILLRFQAHEKAMQVQTLELARRLDRYDEVVKAIRSLENFQSNILGRMAVAGLIGGTIASIIVAVVVRWIVAQ